MKTSFINSSFLPVVKTPATDTRSKIISAADVWNIQRQKKNRVYRRFIL